jgi:hypothetical protein
MKEHDDDKYDESNLDAADELAQLEEGDERCFHDPTRCRW